MCMIYKNNILILFVFINFIIFTKEEIIENPIKIEDDSNIDDYIIIMKEQTVITEKDSIGLITLGENNEIKYNGISFFLGPNIFLCKDESNIYFLFAENKFYEKTPRTENNIEIRSINKIKDFPNNFRHLGYIKEKENESLANLCEIKKDEIIIYGNKNDKFIYFYYIKEESFYTISTPTIFDKMSCKLVISSLYVCAFFYETHVFVGIIAHFYDKDNKALKYQNDKKIEDFKDSNYDNLILYDTDNDMYKILCVSKNKNNIECCAIKVDFTNNSSDKKIEKIEIFDRKLKSDPGFIASISKIHNCYITVFYSQFLLCCGETNKIHCYRKGLYNFDLINEFSLDLLGNINNLIITNKGDYAIISYNNETLTQDYKYQYYIYPPKCNNIILKVNSLLNIKINLTELFERKTNTKYYFRFNSIPSNSELKIGNEEIININDKIEYQPEKEILYLSINEVVITDLNIQYMISIEETYSTFCEITLTKSNDCYHSCEECSENLPNEDKHFCLSCKKEEKYYSYKQKQYNCYNEKEMKQKFTNWYFDEEREIFDRCHENCETCNGVNEDNCLSCKNDNFYLYKGICKEDCPDGTFKTTGNGQIKICKDCYANCATCSVEGNFENMECLTCHEDHINIIIIVFYCIIKMKKLFMIQMTLTKSLVVLKNIVNI